MHLDVNIYFEGKMRRQLIHEMEIIQIFIELKHNYLGWVQRRSNSDGMA